MKLSAALIAGGFSRRMGRDKALLPDAAYGTLLERQFALLATLDPEEFLLSCRPDQSLPVPSAMRRVHDSGTQGPLGGLAALLGAMEGDMLLVLAVDLGRITPEMLTRLAAATTWGCGVVPRSAAGLEPLAACYPATLATEAHERLVAGEDLSLHGFVHAGIASGHLRWLDLTPSEAALFANWNSPADLPGADPI